ncbi:MAG: hypothetical protein IJS94_03630 [Clostridia bacterium]|nr:hypothetical protein [Clostridia bacterium]
MKRIISVALIAAMLIAACVLNIPSVSAANEPVIEQTRVLGDMRISKVNGIWTNPTSNCLIFITPGQSVTGLYYHRLYAVYDEAKNGYVVQKKVWSHWDYAQVVATNAIGLCFNYSPLTAAGAKEALYNWKTWCKIREGDILTLDGIDMKTKKIQTSGKWGTDDFVSNAVITVSTTREEFSGSPYSDVKIVALGDSITSNGGWTEIVGDKLNTHIVNAGVGGDRTDEAIARFNRDVTPNDPDIVIIMFGINDILQWQKYGPSLREKYERNLLTLYNKCAAIGAKVIFMTPNKINYSSYENRFTEYGGMDACFATYRQTMEKVAKDNGCIFVDLFTPWNQLDDVTDYLIDTCHPNGAGYTIFADCMYNCLNDNAGFLADKNVIELKENTEESYGIAEGKYLVGTKAGMTDEEVKALFAKDVEILSEEGVRRVIRYRNEAGLSAICIEAVRGDADGNGKIDSTDYLTVKRALLKLMTPNGAQSISCDANGDRRIDSTDYIAIKRHLLKISSLYNQ